MVIVNKLVLVKVKVYNSTSPSLANLLSTVLFIAVTAEVCNLNKNTEVYEVDYADEVEEDYEDELIDDIDDGKYVVVKSNLSDDEIKDLLGRVRDNLNHMDECFAEMDRIREIFGW